MPHFPVGCDVEAAPPYAQQVEDGESKPDQQNAPIHAGELVIQGKRSQDHHS
jgi:hypothetical protein